MTQVFDFTGDRNHGAKIIDMTNYFDWMTAIRAPIEPANDSGTLTERDILMADILKDFFDEMLRHANKFDGSRAAIQKGVSIYTLAIERTKDVYEV